MRHKGRWDSEPSLCFADLCGRSQAAMRQDDYHPQNLKRKGKYIKRTHDESKLLKQQSRKISGCSLRSRVQSCMVLIALGA